MPKSLSALVGDFSSLLSAGMFELSVLLEYVHFLLAQLIARSNVCYFLTKKFPLESIHFYLHRLL